MNWRGETGWVEGGDQSVLKVTWFKVVIRLGLKVVIRVLPWDQVLNK